MRRRQRTILVRHVCSERLASGGLWRKIQGASRKVGTMKTKTKRETKKKWTVMVYLSGDNDLSDECVWSLKEMFRTSPDDNIGLSVQIDPRAKRIQRFDVSALLKKRELLLGKTKGQRTRGRRDASDHKLLAGGRSLSKGKDRMASVEALQDFIEMTKRYHPAEHYLLVLSGHAGGPFGNSFLVDEFPVHGLSMHGVRTAIMAGGGVDVIGMDSCGMGMAEVGYQLRDCAKVLVGSEGFEQNTGWPYFNVITGIQDEVRAHGNIDARTLGAEIVRRHTEYYSDFLMAGVSTDISACDLQRSDRLAAAVRKLAERLTSALATNRPLWDDEKHKDPRVFVEDLKLSARADSDAIILAHWRAQSYRFERHLDLYDFCELLKNGCRDEGITKACTELMAEIKGVQLKDGTFDGYVIKSCRSGEAFQYSNGVAIYFPWAEVDAGYDDLSFATDTAWVRFLRTYVLKTRRRPRDGDGSVHWVPRFGEVESPFGDREVPSVGIREFPSVGIRGKILTPLVKNPPDVFFEDKC